ncbi:hypothetical protein FBU30_003413 [Linnemannia zychae]|nr:hypothetical protein FBU30_003413 [Linnemannia zychae]
MSNTPDQQYHRENMTVKAEPLQESFPYQHRPQSHPSDNQQQHPSHPYRGHRQMVEDEDEEDEDDLDDDDEDPTGYQSNYHTAYNSAYNSCDEAEDVEMDNVAVKNDHQHNSADHDMAEPSPSFSSCPLPPSSSPTTSSSSFFGQHLPNNNNPHSYSLPSTQLRPSFVPTHHPPPPIPSNQQYRQQHPDHRQLSQALHSSLALSGPSSSTSTATATPASSTVASSSSSSTATPASSPSTHTKPAPSSSSSAPLAAIKPRPALRPLLPSRPTSPQPLNLNRSSDMNKDSTMTSTTSSGSGTGSTGKTRQSAYKINGLNILNRNSLDSRTALEMIRRRRENHNHVERRRRDTLNSTILQIAEILPNCSSTAKLNKGTILRLALDHLRALHTENHSLRSENAALRFFYQGSQMRRQGHPNPSQQAHLHPGQQPPSGSTPGPTGAPTSSTPSGPLQHSMPRNNSSVTPPIIPGPGQGTIPSLTGSQFSSSANMSTSASAPASAGNSPSDPKSHPEMFTTSNRDIIGHSVKRSMSTSGHLHPIMSKPPSKISPSSSPRSRLLPNPSPNGLKPHVHNDAARIGPSPLSSPCSSPPLAPQSANSSALANALPTVPASHQHSAAVSAAAAAAAANSNGRGTATASTRHGHQKNNSGGAPSNAMSGVISGHSGVTMFNAPPGSGSEIRRKYSGQTTHSSHSSVSSTPSSGASSAATSPYASPFPGTSTSSTLQQQQQTQHHNHHHHHHHRSLQQQQQGMGGVTLPSIGTVTNPSSPMGSPIQGPQQGMGSLPLPTPMSLPAPIMGHDAFSKQQSQQGHSYGTTGYSHSIPHPHPHQPSPHQGHHSHPHAHTHPFSNAHPHTHPIEGLPILPPLAPR